MEDSVNGSVNLIVKKGKIVSVFTHLDELPDECVISLKVNKVYGFEEFKEAFPLEQHELEKQKKVINVSSVL
jgi:hypothetical protein